MPSALGQRRKHPDEHQRWKCSVGELSASPTVGDLMRNDPEPAPAQIRIRNLQRAVPVSVGSLERFAAKAVRACLEAGQRAPTDLTRLSEVFVWLVSDRRMASLHLQFLNQTGPTDVLTFQHGEIFISVETARRHARVFGNPLARELRLYIVHGLLHLHGFDDRRRADARKMERMQRRILTAANAKK
jgi:probable rRNA maturation factor